MKTMKRETRCGAAAPVLSVDAGEAECTPYVDGRLIEECERAKPRSWADDGDSMLTEIWCLINEAESALTREELSLEPLIQDLKRHLVFVERTEKRLQYQRAERANGANK